MAFKEDLNLFIGAKYGILKGLKVTENSVLVNKNIQSLKYLSKDDITALAWSDANEEEILVGLSNQTVKVYDTNYKAFNSSTDVRVVDVNQDTKEERVLSSGSICGLARYNGAMVTAVESGHVRVWRYEAALTIDTGGPLSRMRNSQVDSSIIATGGKENELKLWDLETAQNKFTAKNVPADFLEMRVPVWVNDLTFFPNSDKVAVGSRYGYVRMYDPKAQRRPVVNVNLPDKAVTCMAVTHKDHTVLCGLAKGDMVAVDLRMGRSTQNYKGFLGAVRDISCHRTEPYVVSVGLDRFLRVHHLDTKQLLHKEYIVSRMNCVLLRSDVSMKHSEAKDDKKKKRVGEDNQVLLSDGESEIEEALEYDELFKNMETVGESTKKAKKQKRGLDEAVSPKKKRSILVLNPFATPPETPSGKTRKNKIGDLKSADPKEVKEKVTEAKTESKPADDSDDDIMIIEEMAPTLYSSDSGEDSGGESDRDEADGDSDELDELDDSNDDLISGMGSSEDLDKSNKNSSDLKNHDSSRTQKTKTKNSKKRVQTSKCISKS